MSGPSRLAFARPNEREALLNAAFLSLVVAHACKGHGDKTERPLPVALVFVVAPLVLHRPTRQALPRQSNKKLGVWLEEHPVLRAGFARRSRSVVSPVRSGVRMGLRSERLRLVAGGLEALGTPPSGTTRIPLSEEVVQILDRARFTGGWLGRSGPVASVYAGFRIRP